MGAAVLLRPFRLATAWTNPTESHIIRTYVTIEAPQSGINSIPVSVEGFVVRTRLCQLCIIVFIDIYSTTTTSSYNLSLATLPLSIVFIPGRGRARGNFRYQHRVLYHLP